ncbi:hypothetical protein [Thermodesulfovibrio yellowstonii]|uniref:hypothetical protein n=1 Tax=Thermodesulfovibrio yellowstonii TaxID=28262 RepID=UPI00249153F0|nr:hypothetical protein [Thermodesulfovibrio islandicus]
MSSYIMERLKIVVMVYNYRGGVKVKKRKSEVSFRGATATRNLLFSPKYQRFLASIEDARNDKEKTVDARGVKNKEISLWQNSRDDPFGSDSSHPLRMLGMTKKH